MQLTDHGNPRTPLLNDPAKRSLIYQTGVLIGVALLAYYLVTNTLDNLERQAIATGFGFLEKESSFEIGESLIAYSAADTYARALVVGVLNTLKVSFFGIILTILLSTLIGIARLSTNWRVSKLAAAYIELFQDITTAPGVEDRDSAIGEHPHFSLQGHLPGGDHRPVRSAQDHQVGPGEPQLDGIFRRGLHFFGLDLFSLLLFHVQLQPPPGAGAGPQSIEETSDD
jgi:hypothetical protein